MVEVTFVRSPTHVELVGCSSVSGKWDDFERLQAAIYLSTVEPRISFKNLYRKLNKTQIEKITDYIVEEDLNFLRHTWVSFTTNCTRIATMDDESEHQSYTEKSQRYTLARPESHIPCSVEEADMSGIYRHAVQASFDLYYEMEKQGILLEDARDILSLSAMTSIVSTRSTYDELYHLSSCIRGDKPQEIQEIGRRCYDILRLIAPNIFDNEMKILKRFSPRKNFASTRYKNQEIEKILGKFETSMREEPFAMSGKVDMIVSPTEPGFVPALAARTTRVMETYAALKKWHEEKASDQALHRTLQNVMESGHTSVAEHDNYILFSSVTNPLAHQLVRHRHLWDSYTNLTEAGRNLRIAMPGSVKAKGFTQAFAQTVSRLKEAFDRLTDAGIREAYYVLPNATLVDTYVTANAAELLHIVRRRTCKLAQEPIRLRYAVPLWRKMKKNSPAIFSDSGPDCLTNECHEKWPCEKPYNRKRARTDRSRTVRSCVRAHEPSR